MVAAVGDIAAADNADAPVARLVAQMDPAKVLLIGDTAYPNGSGRDYQAYFDPDWGRFRGRFLPVPGNHEYRTKGVAGYRAYFGVPGRLYWSKPVGAWQVIGLDSERPDSKKQLTWLRGQLRANNGRPTLVMWHRPRYSSGEHADQTDVTPLWNAVKKDRDVKLVLWGHDHDYERMSVPVTGRATPLTAMVVGTGGGELRPTPANQPKRQWRKVFADGVRGALKLQLDPGSFSWSFITTSGAVLDSGKQSVS